MAEGLIVRPGDHLIVMIEEEMTLEDLQGLKEAIKKNLPGLADVMVLNHVTAVAVYRPDGGDND